MKTIFDYYLAENLENLFEQEEMGPAEEKAREQTLENPETGRENKLDSIVNNPDLEGTPTQEKAQSIIDNAKEQDQKLDNKEETEPKETKKSDENESGNNKEDGQDGEPATDDSKNPEEAARKRRVNKAIDAFKDTNLFSNVKPGDFNEYKRNLKNGVSPYIAYRNAITMPGFEKNEQNIKDLTDRLDKIYNPIGETPVDYFNPPKKEKPEDINVPKIEPTDEQKEAIEEAKNIVPPSFKTKEDRDKFIDSLSNVWSNCEAFKDISEEKKNQVFENLKECKNPEETYDLIMKENPNADFSQTVALLNLFYNKGVDQDDETQQQLEKLKKDNPDYDIYENKLEEHLGTESSALHTAGALTILAGLALGVFFGPLVAVAGIVAGGMMLYAKDGKTPEKEWYSNIKQVNTKPEKISKTEKNEKTPEKSKEESKKDQDEKTTKEKAQEIVKGKSTVHRRHMETRGVPSNVDIDKLTDEQIKQYGVIFYDDNGNEIDKNKYDQLEKESKDNEKSMIDAKIIENENDKPPIEPEKKHDAVLWLKDKYTKIKKLTGDEATKGKKWFKDTFNKLKSDWGHPHLEQKEEPKIPETSKEEPKPEEIEKKPVETSMEKEPEKTKKTTSAKKTTTKKTTKKPETLQKKKIVNKKHQTSKKQTKNAGKKQHQTSKKQTKNESFEDLMKQFIKLNENKIKEVIKEKIQ